MNIGSHFVLYVNMGGDQCKYSLTISEVVALHAYGGMLDYCDFKHKIV